MAVNFGSSGAQMAMADKLLPVITGSSSRQHHRMGGLGGGLNGSAPGVTTGTPVGTRTTANPAPAQPEQNGQSPSSIFRRRSDREPRGLGVSPPSSASQTGPAATSTPAATNPALGDVATRINAIIADNSPLMQQARTAGMQALNRRGLGNSTMAIEAAEEALYGAAAPIASQESSQASAEGIAAANRAAQQSIAAQQVAAQKTIAAQEDTRARDLSAQEDKRARDLAAQQSTLQKELTALETEKAKALATMDDTRIRELAAQEATLKEKIANLEVQANSAAAEKQLAASRQDALAAQLTAAGNQLSSSTSNLAANPKLKADARAAYQASITAQYKATVDTLNSIYGVPA